MEISNKRLKELIKIEKYDYGYNVTDEEIEAALKELQELRKLQKDFEKLQKSVDKAIYKINDILSINNPFTGKRVPSADLFMIKQAIVAILRECNVVQDKNKRMEV